MNITKWLKSLTRPGVTVEQDGVGAEAKADAEIRVKVYRAATGKWEDLGVVAYASKNPVKQVLGNLKIKIRELRRRLW